MADHAPSESLFRARTRIVATLGPASSSDKTIEEMVRAGVSAFRLNFSHGSHEEHEARVRSIRRASERLGVPVAVLQDLQGPKIRTGDVADGESVLLRVGEIIRVSHEAAASAPGLVATTYKKLGRDVAVGDRILLDDGSMELVCREKVNGELRCEVISGGLLRANKGINLPGVSVSSPSLTQKDRRDLEFGLKLGIDFVALSFVRRASDVRELRQLIRSQGHEVAIIAKIEKPEAVANLAEILEAAEGIMVARGDLGVEVPSERLPVLQKEIITAARQRGRICITATQMLESMISNPRPTRAETSDVANAILDGTDGVMLSGETAVGRHPVAAVAAMQAIARYTEESALYDHMARFIAHDRGHDVADATVHAACTAARELEACALVAFTSSSRTCYKVSFSRPKTRIIGVCFSLKAFNRLALCWGVHAVLVKEGKTIDDLYFLGEKNLLERGLVKPGELTVVVTGSNLTGGGTNTIKVHRAGTIDITADKRVIARFQRLYARLGI